MCGRVVQVTGPLQVAVLCGLDVPDTRFANVPPRYNAAPSQELWAIRQNHETSERSLDLVPYWSKAKPKPPPINAKSETVQKVTMFWDAYRRRRCIMPVDLFFEWKAIKGARAKQPYARHEGRLRLRPRRLVGELEGPGDERMDADLRCPHDRV